MAQFYDANGRLVEGDIQAYLAGETDRWRADAQRRQAAAHRGKVWKTAGAGAALFGGALAAPALFGGAGAGAAAGAGSAALPAAATAGMIPASTAAGAGMTLGNFLNVANLGIGSAASLFGQRSNNRALDRQMQLTREQMAMQAAADAEARAEAKRQFDAQQANDARRFASDDDDRRYNREQMDFNRRLTEEREARRMPYRQASRAALGRLGDFLGVRF